MFRMGFSATLVTVRTGIYASLSIVHVDMICLPMPSVKFDQITLCVKFMSSLSQLSNLFFMRP